MIRVANKGCIRRLGFRSMRAARTRNLVAVSAETALPAKVSVETPKGGFHYSLADFYQLARVIHGMAQIKIDKNGVMLLRSRDELFFQLPKRPETHAAKKKAA